MMFRMTTLLMLLLAAGNAATAELNVDDGWTDTFDALHNVELTARDRKTLAHVVGAHAQLERWANNLVARLERGLQPRQSDPMLDGRALFEVRKLRLTHAASAQSLALAEAIRLLADRHEKRLHVLATMLDYGVDRRRFAAANAELHPVINSIRSANATR